MRFVTLAAALALATSSTTAFGQAAPGATAATDTHYSTAATDIGTLLDDPAAKAIVFKNIPLMAKSDKIDMARSMTLKDMQQYSPDAVSDKVLAEIDAEFSQLPAKK